MFAGHVGAALVLGNVDRRLNLGLLAFAAMMLDFVLWLLVLAGWESVVIPADFARTHQPRFLFPYSHGLIAAAAWSALAGAFGFFWFARNGNAGGRAALVIATAVFSHWLLDFIVHSPEMPVAGGGTPQLGLGLWDAMPVALTLEALIAIGGAWLFLNGANLPRARAAGLSVLVLVVLVSTIAGMTVAPPPPSSAAMAATSLVTILVVVLLAAWLGRRRSA
jgi:hypothetical protein